MKTKLQLVTFYDEQTGKKAAECLRVVPANWAGTASRFSKDLTSVGEIAPGYGPNIKPVYKN